MRGIQSGRFKEVPSLKEFMSRRQVIELYRDMLRASKPLEAEQRRDIRAFAKREFKNMREVTDQAYIRQLIREGRRQVEYLEHLQNMAR